MIGAFAGAAKVLGVVLAPLPLLLQDVKAPGVANIAELTGSAVVRDAGPVFAFAADALLARVGRQEGALIPPAAGAIARAVCPVTARAASPVLARTAEPVITLIADSAAAHAAAGMAIRSARAFPGAALEASTGPTLLAT